MRLGIFCLLGIAVYVGGCAEMTSVYHSRKLSTNQVITVDGYQRSTYVTHVTGDPDGQFRLCAEAAPDTFAALSASLAAEGDVAKKSASLAAAISQSGATIERTQTINLLRESMYRTCERYLSGAMDKSSFFIQAARDQRTMVTVLAVEQLTRTAQASSTRLGAPKTSAAVLNRDAAALIKQFSDEKAASEKAATAAQISYANAKKVSDCEVIKTAPAADPELKNWTSCITAKAELDTRQSDAKAANDRLDKVLDVSGNAGTTMAGTAELGSNDGGSETSPEPTLTTVALAVRDIALTSGIDEPLMFCIATFSDRPERLPPATIDVCNQIIAQRFANDEKARSQILRFQADGTAISVVTANPIITGDVATPILRRYLTDTSLQDIERKRRNVLAAQIAVQLRLIESPQELPQLIYAADPARSARLLVELRSADTTKLGAAALVGK